MKMLLSDIANAMGAAGDIPEDRLVTRVCIDSRSVQSGDIFFCIVGQKMDGHQFAAQAVEKGACAIVASSPMELDVPLLLVRDTTTALGKLARFWREQTDAKVVGVTGSAGKTTVKEMLAQVLSARGKTAKNFKNLNNQIGLPLSILEMDGDEAFWVLELGISRPGDMDELGQILCPDAALIVNIGPCHLEGLGDLAGVAREKSVLLDHVRANGFGCISADYPLLVEEGRRKSLRQILYSAKGAQAAYVCTDRDDSVLGKVTYSMQIHSQQRALTVSAHAHVSENMAAVTAMAMELGLSLHEIESALMHFVPVAQRFVQSRIGSWLFIDDTYNANPVSMTKSILEAKRIAGNKLLVLVLADMRELGEEGRSAHEQLGQTIVQSDCMYCFFTGAHAADVLRGMGGQSKAFVEVNSAEEVLNTLAPIRFKEGVMLFKGSRSCRMENYYTFMERSWA